jgi:hypothetical protein
MEREPQVHLDPADLGPVESELREPLEEQLSSALRGATEAVRASYAGESVAETTERLLAGARDRLHPDVAAGFEPDRAQLAALAEQIAQGERT